MKLLFYPTLFFLLCISFVKQKQIRHDQHSALNWKNFKGRADRKSKYYANTSSGYQYSASLVGDSLKVEVPCYFFPYQSWLKKGKGTPELLKHEQVHFDITEVYTRKIRSEIKRGKYTLKNANKSIVKIIKKYDKQLNAAQKKYDKETNHSINEEEQKKWNALVEKQLIHSAKDAEPTIMLKVK